MRLTRRFFLKSSGIALVGLGVVPRFLARAAAATAGKGKILVVIFQRGAADGLNIVVPHAEKTYYDLRPSIAIPTSAQIARCCSAWLLRWPAALITSPAMPWRHGIRMNRPPT